MFSHKELVSLLPEESVELAMDALMGAARQEGKLETLSELNKSKTTKTKNELAAELKAAFPDARQCGRCGTGPVMHRSCSDLRSHHGRDGISNACSACDWFAADINLWPRWTGELSAQYMARSEEGQHSDASALIKQCNALVKHLWDNMGTIQASTDLVFGSLVVWAAVSLVCYIGAAGWRWLFSCCWSLSLSLTGLGLAGIKFVCWDLPIPVVRLASLAGLGIISLAINLISMACSVLPALYTAFVMGDVASSVLLCMAFTYLYTSRRDYRNTDRYRRRTRNYEWWSRSLWKKATFCAWTIFDFSAWKITGDGDW